MPRADDRQRDALLTIFGGRAGGWLAGFAELIGDHNAPGADVGPGQIATWGVAADNEVEAFGFKWSWPGRSSKHFPFDWSGPEEG